jgi:hypothetical protein
MNDNNRYYDLIALPSGGHIPVDILEDEYKVSREIISKIPCGKPRNNETFSCPICGTKSYYAGVCDGCILAVDEDDVFIYSDEQLKNFDVARLDRKEKEYNEILNIIDTKDWSNCEYIKG